MIKESITPQELVDFLNSLLDIDRDAISNLFHSRVWCNKSLANHPTVQVAGYPEGDLPIPRVGILGLLNGVFGCFDSSRFGCISMNVDRDKINIQKFYILSEDQTPLKAIEGLKGVNYPPPETITPECKKENF